MKKQSEMSYLLKYFHPANLLALLLLMTLFPHSLSAEQSLKKPGEPLVRVFIDLFQDKSQETRLEAYFLSVGLPNRPEHTAVLRQQLTNANPLERTIILFALAAMTREPSDIDAFLEAFPTKEQSFYDLMAAEWYLSNTLNMGMADFLILLVYEPRTRERAIPHLARITYNIPVESLNRYLKDQFISEYVKEHALQLNMELPPNELKFQKKMNCTKQIEALMQSSDQESRAVALLMTQRTPENSEKLDALLYEKKRKGDKEEIHRFLILKKCSFISDFIATFPQNQQEIKKILQTEKLIYRPPLRGVIFDLWSALQPRPEANGAMKWHPNKEELQRLRAVLSYGETYLEAYERYCLRVTNCESIELTEELVSRGKEAALRKNVTQAISYFDQGLESIGTAYHFDNLIDDTDLKLLLASEFQKKGELEHAANLKQKMLLIRLDLFKQKYKCK